MQDVLSKIFSFFPRLHVLEIGWAVLHEKVILTGDYQIILPEIRTEGIRSPGNVMVKSGIHFKKNCVLKSKIQLQFYRDGLFKKSQIKGETVMILYF